VVRRCLLTLCKSSALRRRHRGSYTNANLSYSPDFASKHATKQTSFAVCKLHLQALYASFLCNLQTSSTLHQSTRQSRLPLQASRHLQALYASFLCSLQTSSTNHHTSINRQTKMSLIVDAILRRCMECWVYRGNHYPYTKTDYVLRELCEQQAGKDTLAETY
jgi:hypothetical protein